MIVSVIQIGNSRGVRLPKAILEQLHIDEKLNLEVTNQQIILKPIKNQDTPRIGWEDAFKSMAACQEDALLVQDVEEPEGFEWEW